MLPILPFNPDFGYKSRIWNNKIIMPSSMAIPNGRGIATKKDAIFATSTISKRISGGMNCLSPSD
jgi:hypothetical protein